MELWYFALRAASQNQNAANLVYRNHEKMNMEIDQNKMEQLQRKFKKHALLFILKRKCKEM